MENTNNSQLNEVKVTEFKLIALLKGKGKLKREILVTKDIDKGANFMREHIEDHIYIKTKQVILDDMA